jgi:hypothetical protein
LGPKRSCCCDAQLDNLAYFLLALSKIQNKYISGKNES